MHGGVDSGQFGFFDDSKYPDHNRRTEAKWEKEWYDPITEITLPPEDATFRASEIDMPWREVRACFLGEPDDKKLQEYLNTRAKKVYPYLFQQLGAGELEGSQDLLKELAQKKYTFTLKDIQKIRRYFNHPGGGVFKDVGAVTLSGYGDGGYPIFAAKKNGEVIALKVVYIGDEDEDEDEDE